MSGGEGGLRAAVEALADKWIAADDLTQWGDHTRGFCGRDLRALLAATPAGDDAARALDEVERLLLNVIYQDQHALVRSIVREVRAALAPEPPPP